MRVLSLRVYFLSFFFMCLSLFSFNAVGDGTVPLEKNEIVKQKPKSNVSVPVKNSFSPIVKKVLPSVVQIFSIKLTNQNNAQQEKELKKFFEELEEFFGHKFQFQLPQKEEKGVTPILLGCGVIVDAKKAYIVTNFHVIQDVGEPYLIVLNDGRQLEAKLIGSDPDTDLAVIQINGSNLNLTACPIGDSSALEVGDFVLAIGAPLGLPHTVTSGIVSALGRTNGVRGAIGDFIQTDASINFGNSGGALIDLNGELIGINSFLKTTKFGDGSVGLGFAIASNTVKSVSDRLISVGKVERGRLGVVVQSASPEILDAMGVKSSTVKGGVIVTKIEKNSPADNAKLKIGDIIVSVDNQDVINAYMIYNIVSLKPIGSKVDVKVIRDKKYLNISVEVAKINPDSSYSHPVKRFDKIKGVVFSNIVKEHELYGKKDGIVIVDIDKSSKAYASDLRNGDLIVSINQVKIKNVEEFEKELNKNKDSVLLHVVDKNESSMFVVLKLDE